MTYMCFIESDIWTVPHMEPLTAGTPRAAEVEARALLASHASGIAAHVFEGEIRVVSVRREAQDQ